MYNVLRTPNMMEIILQPLAIGKPQQQVVFSIVVNLKEKNETKNLTHVFFDSKTMLQL